MTGIKTLLDGLEARGIILSLVDGALRYQAPHGSLDADTRMLLRSRRSEIIMTLASNSARPTGALPLAGNQAGLWFIERAGMAGHGYVTPVNLHLRGALDTERLRVAIETIVHRHEALRTAFVEANGTPQQLVLPPARFSLELTDLSDLPDPEAALSRLVEEENRKPFDLTRPPLLRARLIRLEPARHTLLAAFHHIAFDGWSMRVFADELTQLHAGNRLEPLSIQIPDLALQEQRQDMTRDIGWWQAELSGLRRCELAADHPRPATSRHRGSATRFRLPDRIMAVAREEQATPFMALLASFLLLLGRVTGEERPSIGTPVANRGAPGAEALIGFMVNTMVLRGDLRGDPSFRMLLQRTRETVLAGIAHQAVPFDRVVQALQPARALSQTPLFSVLFAVQDAQAVAPDFALTGLDVTAVPHTELAARFDLEIHAWPTSDGFEGIAVHDADLFEPATIECLMQRWSDLQAAAASAPDRPISTLPFATADETAQLAAWNDTHTHDTPTLLHQIFERQARLTPDAEALRTAGGPVTYAALDRRADLLAACLRAQGAGPEVPVALCLSRGGSLYVAMLAILKTGACIVPLDPDDAPRRHDAIVSATRPLLALADGAAATRLARHLPVIDPDAIDLSAMPLPPGSGGSHADMLAAIIHTSGSTGVPKGVEMTHRALSNLVTWHAAQLGDRGRRTLGFTHQAFDVFFQEAFTTWALGGTLVLLDAHERRDPETIAARIGAEGIERLFMPFSPLSQLLDALARRGGGDTLRELHSAGEAVHASTGLLGFLASHPDCRLVNHYGPTEAYVVTTHLMQPGAAIVPIGQPIQNLRVQVIDAAGNTLPPGMSGQIAAAGVGLARGYHRRPDLTAALFRPDPAGHGTRRYLTGDRGRIDARDGSLVLTYLGRQDTQLKLRGFRVEPAEIEAVLLAQPELDAAAVVFRDGVLAAHVVPAPSHAARDTTLLGETLRLRLKDLLPDYMIPAVILPVQSLALLPNGKIDRAALAAIPAATQGAAPRSPIEESLATLFAEILFGDTSGRAVGPHDDFFALGGHSLLATRLVSRIRDTLGIELPLRRLFETPSVAGLAEAMQDGDIPLDPPRPGQAPAGPAALSFAQARLWLLDRLGLTMHAYVMPVALRLRGRLDIAALEQALTALCTRHEPLRTIFREIEGEPRQVVLPPEAMVLAYQPALAAELPARIAAEHETLFDLSRDRPFRAQLLRLAGDDWVLLCALHHIAADGWSLPIITRELGMLYTQALSGGPPPAPLVLRYADYAHWQNALMTGPLPGTQLAYWRTRLSGLAPLALPLDRSRPAFETFRGASRPVLLPPGLGPRLVALGRSHGTTPFMTLLAGFQALLHRLSGQDRFAVGIPVANRNRRETEGLVGFFVNALAIDAECSDDPSFAGHLARVRERCLGAFMHQDVPFEQVVQALAPARNLSSNPIFNTIFAVQASETMAPHFTLPELEVEVLPPTEMTVRFDMELHLWPTADGFSGFLAYNRDLFDAGTIDGWIAAYVALLTAAADAPQQPLSRLRLSGTAAEMSLRGPPARRTSLTERFAQIVERHGAAPALTAGGETISYVELDRRSDRLAAALRMRGIGTESIVGIMLERSAAAIVAMLAVLKAGGAYLPLDPAMPAARRDVMLADARAALVIGIDGFETGPVMDAAPILPHPDQLACVMYTSGSSGVPKGVAVTHANLASRCIEPDFMRAGPGETMMLHAPLAFDASSLEIWAPLMNGGCVAIAPPGLLSLAEIARFITEAGVTSLWLTAGLFQELATAHPQCLRGCRQLLSGGDVVSPAAVRAVLGHGLQFSNGYGPTETTIFALTHRVTDAAGLSGTLPIGLPVAGTTIHLLDGSGRPVPPGLPGEIHVGGAGVARGYLARPADTAQRFVPDPFPQQPGARLYRTGDRARLLADGSIAFLGRQDRQIKLRGHRIELGDIEAALRASPDVAEAVVTVEADQRLVAHIVPRHARDTQSHVRGWADLFDEQIYGAQVYEARVEPADSDFDITGWISSYDNTPIPPAEMRDWVAETIRRVGSRMPRDVIEIGCGTGLLLRRLAPLARRYVGTDTSAVVLARLSSTLDLPQVTLLRRDASDWSGIADASFDCVLLSSVVQYFPDLSYLSGTIRQAQAALRPAGVIHLADIRDLRHHRRLLSATEIARSDIETSVDAVRRSVQRRLEQETELLVDPALFATLSGVAALELHLQPGPAHNELTRYRYTAILHATPPLRVEAATIPAQTLDDVVALLSGEMPLVVTGLPNSRLATDAAIQAALDAADRHASAASLRAIASNDGVDPAELLALAERLGLACVLAPSLVDPDCFDAGFHHPGMPVPLMPSWRLSPVATEAGTPAGPRRWLPKDDLLPRLRAHLGAALPDYMMPSAFSLLDRLPLTASGKIDRAALRAPTLSTGMFTAPAGALEIEVAACWAQALGLPRVSTTDDFFALGGHSLLAARIAAMLRARLGREVPLRLFFEAPSVAAFAARLSGLDAAAALAPILPDPASEDRPFPLTDVQQAYWIGRDSAFAGGGTAAHIYFEVDSTSLDPDRLEAAWNALIRRHGMLRAIVGTDGLQRILRTVAPYRIARHARPDGVRERLASEVMPPDRWPLFRVELSRLPDGWRLHMGLDTLVVDAHSLHLLFTELRQAYDMPALALPPLALSFRDVVAARLAAQETPDYARSCAYWHDRLDRMPPAPALPLASPAPTGAPHFSLLSHLLDTASWARLRETAGQHSISPTGAVLAAFAAVLGAWSADTRFTLNLTRFDRPDRHPDMGKVVGDFTALLLLAVEPEPGAAFATRAAALQKRLWEGLEHPEPGGVALMREISRRQGRPPGMLFPVVFTSLLGLPEGREGEQALSAFGPVGYRAAQTPQIWLDHGVAELDGALALTWNLLDGVFPEGVAEAMFASYLRLLQQLADDSRLWEHPVSGLLPPLQGLARQRANATATPRAPDEALLHAGLLRAAAQDPDSPAVIAADRTLSHGALVNEAATLAGRLRRMGVDAGTVIAVVLHKGWEQAVATLAVLMAKAAYLPIDPGVPTERLRLLLDNADVRVVLTHSALSGLGWPGRVTCLEVDRMADEPPASPIDPGPPDPNSLAYIIYTSGSTGLPKGVMIEHAAVANTLADLRRRLSLTASDRVLSLSSLSFDLSVWDLFGVPGAGGAVVMPPPDTERDPAALDRLAARHGVTLWNSVPQLLQMQMDHTPMSWAGPRAALLSGDWIAPDLASRARACWPGVRLVGLGGATEASIWSILHEIGPQAPGWSSIPYGLPMQNQTIHVLDANGQAKPDWAEGEIHIGGMGLARGYHGDTPRTGSSFIQDALTGERLYRTGDRGRVRPGGVVEFLGRRDGQVKLNGFRVELGEVEAVLASAPSVAQAVVLMQEAVSGGHRLAAFVSGGPAGRAIGRSRHDQALQQIAGLAMDAALDDAAGPAFHDAWSAENARYHRLAAGALSALGLFRAAGERWELDAALARSGIAPRYRAWLARALAALADTGMLTRAGPAFLCYAPLHADAEGAHLADILTERVHSAELYADPAIPALYERVFGACHRSMAAAIGWIVAALPKDRIVRVLEVGAGYATATRHLLPMLPADRTHYLFTDISRFFLTRAAEQLHDYPFVEYALLDLDRPAVSQDVPQGSIDIIVAASVLHDARRLRETLSDLMATLRPGGVLLAIEETQFHPAYDLGMGLQQGFDGTADRGLRPCHPLLSREQWHESLHDAGFASSEVVSQPGSVSDALGLDLVLARAAGTMQGPDSDMILAHARAHLPAHMVPRSVTVLAALPLSSNGKIDRSALAALAPRAAAGGDHVAPRTPLEAELLSLWADLLENRSMGVTSNLFEQGADSLLATRALSRIRTAHGIELPLRTLFERPTIALLAEAIEARRWIVAEPDDAGSRSVPDYAHVEKTELL